MDNKLNNNIIYILYIILINNNYSLQLSAPLDVERLPGRDGVRLGEGVHPPARKPHAGCEYDALQVPGTEPLLLSSRRQRASVWNRRLHEGKRLPRRQHGHLSSGQRLRPLLSGGGGSGDDDDEDDD